MRNKPIKSEKNFNCVCSIWTTYTHSGSLRNYTNGVIQVNLWECKMRLNNNNGMYIGITHKSKLISPTFVSYVFQPAVASCS